MRSLASMVALVALALAVLAAGCGGDDENDAPAAAATTTATEPAPQPASATAPEAEAAAETEEPATEAEEPAITPATFKVQANRVCRTSRTQLRAVNRKARRAKTLEAAGRGFREQTKVYRRGTNRLAAIPVPEEQADEIGQYLKERRAVGSGQGKASDALIAGNRKATARAIARTKTSAAAADKIARRLGLTSCLTP